MFRRFFASFALTLAVAPLFAADSSAPSVLYLYPSSRDDQIGVRCWSSRDLTNWRYEGVCCDDETTKGAYAPEVFRWNDAFYMVSSPAGRGHYIYRGASPVGPFERVTENFGLSIDGSAFIDSDGNAYFYSAADPAILAYRMTAPNAVDPKPLPTKLNMRGWTEGPNVFCVDGVYYATYCGNHVFSPGYRIDAASGPSPLDLTPVPDVPVLVSAEGAPVGKIPTFAPSEAAPFGIGHNSVVKGPNLDLYYLAYHTLLGRGKVRGWPVRDSRLDRLVLNRDILTVVGPTRTPQTLPLPDAAAWFDADADLARLETVDGAEPPRLDAGFLRLGAESAVLLRDSAFDADFTAEFNVALPSKTGKAGVLFAYRDAQNFGRVEIDGATNRVRLVFTVDGRETATEIAPPGAFGEPLSFASLRSVQVERSGYRYSFYVDDRKLADLENDALRGGKIGYFTSTPDALFGFLGATAATEGRSAARLAEPVPGALSFGYRATNAGRSPVEVATKSGKRLRVAELQSGDGDAISLELDVEEAGLYDVALRYSAPEEARATLEIAGSDAVEIALSPTQDGAFATAIRRRIALPTGKTRLQIAAASGSFRLARLDLTLGADVPAGTDFAPVFDASAYSDGSWAVVDGSLVAKGEKPFGKRLYGDPAWGDYRIDATLEFLDGRPNAGLVFRVQNPALGGPNNSPKLGTDFFRGYFVGFNGSAVVLGKHSFDWKLLARQEFHFKPNQKIDLRVEVRGAQIVVFIDGAEALRYVDDAPFVSGRVGVRACDAALKVDRLSVEPLE